MEWARPCYTGLEFVVHFLYHPDMARSSTSFFPKWKSGKTTVVRVPEVLADEVLAFAKELDAKAGSARELQAAYRTAADVDIEEPVNVAAVPQRSPFRYPGGKTWLVPYVRTWLRSLDPKAVVLVEPFAGGGIIGLTAGFERLADHVVLVEKDPDVAAVWRTILGRQAEWLAKRIESFDLTKERVLRVLETPPAGRRGRAFAALLRNRVQRGGIMAPGAGLVKNGENGRGLHSRWYPATLAKRIRAIAAMRQRFCFIEGDAMDVIEAYADDDGAAFFVDPPYTVAARRLYAHWQVDHRRLFQVLSNARGSFLLTYDNTAEIAALATEFHFDTQAVAMKNTHHALMTELLVGKDLSWLRNAQVSAGSLAQTAQGILAFRP